MSQYIPLKFLPLQVLVFFRGVAPLTQKCPVVPRGSPRECASLIARSCQGKTNLLEIKIPKWNRLDRMDRYHTCSYIYIYLQREIDIDVDIDIDTERDIDIDLDVDLERERDMHMDFGYRNQYVHN